MRVRFWGGMRNIRGGGVLGVCYFGGAVGVGVVLGMLFEEVLGGL